MAIEPEEPRKKTSEIVLGEDISTLSVFELEGRITALKNEIARSEAAILLRQSTRSAADAFFKR